MNALTLMLKLTQPCGRIHWNVFCSKNIVEPSNLNIVVLSDLNWEVHLRTMTQAEVDEFQESDLEKLRYERIRRYFEIVLQEKADLVLFAGDLTGDGFCGRGFHFAFITLLKLLEQREIHSCFIAGNHDPDEYYDQVLSWAEQSKFTQEISGRRVSIKGLQILGVNYDTSKSKRALAKLLKQEEAPLDIVLGHSQIKRRIRHFDFTTRYLFTGHYDRKLFAHRETVFVALDNDSEEVSYGVLNIRAAEADELSIKIRQNPRTTYGYTEIATDLLQGKRNIVLSENGVPTYDLLKFENASDKSLSRDGDHFLYLKYLRGINYCNSLDTMYKMSQELPLGITDLSLNQIHGLPITASYKISESMIEDYLGDVID